MAPDVIMLLNPFRPSAWITISLCIILVTLLAVASSTNLFVTVTMSMLFKIASILLEQGAMRNSTQDHLKFKHKCNMYSRFLISWLLMTVVLANAYKGDLISEVVVPHSDKQFLKKLTDIQHLMLSLPVSQYVLNKTQKEEDFYTPKYSDFRI